MTTTPTTPRCSSSDLPQTECAHCRGDFLDVPASDTPAWYPGAAQPTGGTRVEFRTVVRRQAAHREEKTNDPLVRAARDLRVIREYADDLRMQAVVCADNQLMPGGRAMVALGPAAWPEAARHTWDTIVREVMNDPLERLTIPEDYDDADDEAPLQLLLGWSEGWRIDLDADIPTNPTLASEADWLTARLNWAHDNDPGFEAFAADVAKARRILEQILYAGEHADRTRVPCTYEPCERKPYLIRVYASGPEADDRWKCPYCRHLYDANDLYDAYAKHLRSEGAHRWVRVADAVAVLRTQGRPESTTRRWLADMRCRAYCDTATRQVYVWWPELWSLHLDPPRRGRPRMHAA